MTPPAPCRRPSVLRSSMAPTLPDEGRGSEVDVRATTTGPTGCPMVVRPSDRVAAPTGRRRLRAVSPSVPLRRIIGAPPPPGRWRWAVATVLGSGGWLMGTAVIVGGALLLAQ